MVQFNQNLNINKTIKLTSTVQVGKTGAVENKQQPKAESKAVWIEGMHIDTNKLVEGDYLVNTKTGEYQIWIKIGNGGKWMPPEEAEKILKNRK